MIAVLMIAMSFPIALQDNQANDLDVYKLSPGNVNFFLEAVSVLSQNKELQKELEILPGQISEIDSKVTAASKEYTKVLRAAKTSPTLDEEQQQKQIHQAYLKYAKDVHDTLDNVLLKHQTENLLRVLLWAKFRDNQMRFGGMGRQRWKFESPLTNSFVKELLDIDKATESKINDKSTRLQEAFRRDLAELHDKYEKQLLDLLSPEQKSKAKSLLGDTPPFFFAPIN